MEAGVRVHRLAELRAAKIGQLWEELGLWGERAAGGPSPALTRPCLHRWVQPLHPYLPHQSRPEARSLGLDPVAAVWDLDLLDAMEAGGEKGAT